MIRSVATVCLFLPVTLPQGGPVAEEVVPPELEAALLRASEFEGDLGEGIERVETLAMAGDYDTSLALSELLLAPNEFARWRQDARSADGKLNTILELVDPLFEGMGWLGAPEPHRAELHFARGVVLMRRGKQAADGSLRDESATEYLAARALAGPGELREDSVYNLGVGFLEEAEGVRLEIPEVREKLGLPALPPTQPPAPPQGAPAAPPAPEEEPPDPLELARGFYLSAREHFVERLRLDWRDEDTRANVELIQRRLKELDEIERQREEQEQEQESEENDPNQESEQSEDGENSDQQDEQDPDQQEEPQDSEPEESENSEEEEEPAEEKPEEPHEEEGESEGEEKEPQQPAEPQERLLTREEVQRLLEQLEKIEEEAEKVEAQLRDKRKVPVRRDW